MLLLSRPHFEQQDPQIWVLVLKSANWPTNIVMSNIQVISANMIDYSYYRRKKMAGQEGWGKEQANALILYSVAVLRTTEYRHTSFYYTSQVLRCCFLFLFLFFLNKWKARVSTSKKTTTGFIERRTFLWWSGTEPTLYRRSACTAYYLSQPNQGDG